MKKISKFFLIACCSSLMMTSCSDLEPEFKDVITEQNYFVNDEAFVSALGSAYTNLYGIMNHGNLFSLQEVSSDEACIPHKGPDWEDGNQWIRMHKHDFFKGEGVINGVWNFCYGGINTCNRLIATFESVDNPNSAAFIAELKVLRAYYYSLLLDIYGNVPIVDRFDVPDGFKPATVSRAEVFAFIEKDLKDNVPLLSKAANLTTYGRMNYYVGQALLANLYLNAEAYIGTARYSDAVAACDEIINSGEYSLESNYFTNFAVNNGGSNENIWVIPYDKVFAQGFNLVQMTLHYESQKTFNLVEQPWNGYCTLADFYNSFSDDDIRKTGGSRGYGVMLAGVQRSSGGEVLLDNSDAWFPDNDGRVVNFNPVINELAPAAHRDGGARLSKYEYEIGSTNSMSNDFAMFRYAEILMNKAEALWRMNPGSSEALELVNMIRMRAGVDPFTSLNADNFLAERGREFCFEIKRRTDLIRFDKWGAPWWEKPASEPFKKLMPIPQPQIDLNQNLRQNPGYN